MACARQAPRQVHELGASETPAAGRKLEPVRVLRKQRTVTRSELEEFTPWEQKQLLEGGKVVKGGYEVRLGPEPRGGSGGLRRSA